MHSLFSLITAASLILHLGLGCCAHHVHSHDNRSQTAATTHSHGHVPDEHSQTSDQSEPHKKDCQEPSCVYLSGAKVVLTHDIAPLTTAVVPTATDSLLCERCSQRSHIEVESGHRVPMRLHLYYQILLI